MALGTQIEFENRWFAVEKKLAGYFYRKGADRDDIRDLVQETAVRACEHYHTLRGEFQPWIFGIARHVYLEYLRKCRNRYDADPAVPVSDNSSNPERNSISRKLLADCLDRLETLHRQCLVLHDHDGFTFQEISEKLGIPRSNVHYHVESARKILKKEFPELIISNGKMVT